MGKPPPPRVTPRLGSGRGAEARKPQETFMGRDWNLPTPMTLKDRLDERRAKRAKDRDSVEAEAGDEGVSTPPGEGGRG